MKIFFLIIAAVLLLGVSPWIAQALNVLFGKGIYPLWCPYIFSGMPSFASLMGVPLSPLIFAMCDIFVIWLGIYLLKETDERFNCTDSEL